MKRRTFLKQLAATPLIFGLGSLLAQDGESTPSWYREALAKMKETGRYGIVLIVPSKEPTRTEIKNALSSALAGKGYPLVFCEAVFIFLVQKLAVRLVGETGEWANRILLDPTGNEVAADRVSLAPLLEGKDFSPSFERFLHGKDNLRLRKQVRKMEVPEKVRVALEQIESDKIEERSNAEMILQETGDQIVPALTLLRITTDSEETRARIDTILKNHSGYPVSIAPNGVAHRNLPYGVSVEKMNLKKEAPRFECPGCGSMAYVPALSKEFLVKTLETKVPIKFRTR